MRHCLSKDPHNVGSGSEPVKWTPDSRYPGALRKLIQALPFCVFRPDCPWTLKLQTRVMWRKGLHLYQPSCLWRCGSDLVSLGWLTLHHLLLGRDRGRKEEGMQYETEKAVGMARGLPLRWRPHLWGSVSGPLAFEVREFWLQNSGEEDMTEGPLSGEQRHGFLGFSSDLTGFHWAHSSQVQLLPLHPEAGSRPADALTITFQVMRAGLMYNE